MRADEPGGADPPPPPVPAERAHAAGRRLRLRLTDRHDLAGMEALADHIAACPGVASVAIRPNTRSVIVEGHVEAGALAERLSEAGVLAIREPGPPPPVGQVMEFGLLQIDGRLKDRSRGALDLHAALALLLLAGAAIQAARGRVAGPATTLAMAALALIERGGRGR